MWVCALMKATKLGNSRAKLELRPSDAIGSYSFKKKKYLLECVLLFFKKIILFIYLFIFGCAGSSLMHRAFYLLCRGFSLW